MEAAAIFVIGAIHRVRTGGVMQMWSEEADSDRTMHALLSTSVESLRVLIAEDREGRQWP